MTHATPHRALARHLLAGLALATAAAATAVVAVAAPADARATLVDPADLERGADAAVPYLDGRRVVDGDRQVRVRGRRVALLGTAADGRHVVDVVRDGERQVRSVGADGGARTLVDLGPGDAAVLGGDGEVLAVVRHRFRDDASVVRAYAATTGERVGRRAVRGFAQVLDTDVDTVLFSTSPPERTVAWDLTTDLEQRVSRFPGYAADLATDRLAVLTGDPYQGGCSRVSTVSDARTVLWRSCSEAVATFDDDGSHVATVHLLTDGLGPDEVRVRTVGGEPVARYRVDGFFGRLLAEPGGALLLETSTRDSSGLVRCTGADCELASDLGEGSPWL